MRVSTSNMFRTFFFLLLFLEIYADPLYLGLFSISDVQSNSRSILTQPPNRGGVQITWVDGDSVSQKRVIAFNATSTAKSWTSGNPENEICGKKPTQKLERLVYQLATKTLHHNHYCPIPSGSVYTVPRWVWVYFYWKQELQAVLKDLQLRICIKTKGESQCMVTLNAVIADYSLQRGSGGAKGKGSISTEAKGGIRGGVGGGWSGHLRFGSNGGGGIRGISGGGNNKKGGQSIIDRIKGRLSSGGSTRGGRKGDQSITAEIKGGSASGGLGSGGIKSGSGSGGIKGSGSSSKTGKSITNKIKDVLGSGKIGGGKGSSTEGKGSVSGNIKGGLGIGGNFGGGGGGSKEGGHSRDDKGNIGITIGGRSGVDKSHENDGKSIKDKIKGGLGIKGSVKGSASGGIKWNGSSQGGKSIKNKVKGSLKSIKNQVKDSVHKVKNKVKDSVHTVKNKIKDTSKSIKYKVKDASTSIKNKVKDIKHKTKDSLGNKGSLKGSGNGGGGAGAIQGGAFKGGIRFKGITSSTSSGSKRKFVKDKVKDKFGLGGAIGGGKASSGGGGSVKIKGGLGLRGGITMSQNNGKDGNSKLETSGSGGTLSNQNLYLALFKLTVTSNPNSKIMSVKVARNNTSIITWQKSNSAQDYRMVTSYISYQGLKRKIRITVPSCGPMLGDHFQKLVIQLYRSIFQHNQNCPIREGTQSLVPYWMWQYYYWNSRQQEYLNKLSISMCLIDKKESSSCILSVEAELNQLYTMKKSGSGQLIPTLVSFGQNNQNVIVNDVNKLNITGGRQTGGSRPVIINNNQPVNIVKNPIIIVKKPQTTPLSIFAKIKQFFFNTINGAKLKFKYHLTCFKKHPFFVWKWISCSEDTGIIGQGNGNYNNGVIGSLESKIFGSIDVVKDLVGDKFGVLIEDKDTLMTIIENAVKKFLNDTKYCIKKEKFNVLNWFTCKQRPSYHIRPCNSLTLETMIKLSIEYCFLPNFGKPWKWFDCMKICKNTNPISGKVIHDIAAVISFGINEKDSGVSLKTVLEHYYELSKDQLDKVIQCITKDPLKFPNCLKLFSIKLRNGNISGGTKGGSSDGIEGVIGKIFGDSSEEESSESHSKEKKWKFPFNLGNIFKNIRLFIKTKFNIEFNAVEEIKHKLILLFENIKHKLFNKESNIQDNIINFGLCFTNNPFSIKNWYNCKLYEEYLKGELQKPASVRCSDLSVFTRIKSAINTCLWVHFLDVPHWYDCVQVCRSEITTFGRLRRTILRLASNFETNVLGFKHGILEGLEQEIGSLEHVLGVRKLPNFKYKLKALLKSLSSDLNFKVVKRFPGNLIFLIKNHIRKGLNFVKTVIAKFKLQVHYLATYYHLYFRFNPGSIKRTIVFNIKYFKDLFIKIAQYVKYAVQAKINNIVNHIKSVFGRISGTVVDTKIGTKSVTSGILHIWLRFANFIANNFKVAINIPTHVPHVFEEFFKGRRSSFASIVRIPSIIIQGIFGTIKNVVHKFADIVGGIISKVTGGFHIGGGIRGRGGLKGIGGILSRGGLGFSAGSGGRFGGGLGGRFGGGGKIGLSIGGGGKTGLGGFFGPKGLKSNVKFGKKKRSISYLHSPVPTVPIRVKENGDSSESDDTKLSFKSERRKRSDSPPLHETISELKSFKRRDTSVLSSGSYNIFGSHLMRPGLNFERRKRSNNLGIK